MPCTCLSICVDVTAKFGLQCQDLNISLTAIGLLVRIVTVSFLAVDSAVWILYVLYVKLLACQKEHPACKSDSLCQSSKICRGTPLENLLQVYKKYIKVYKNWLIE